MKIICIKIVERGFSVKKRGYVSSVVVKSDGSSVKATYVNTTQEESTDDAILDLGEDNEKRLSKKREFKMSEYCEKIGCEFYDQHHLPFALCTSPDGDCKMTPHNLLVFLDKNGFKIIKEGH